MHEDFRILVCDDSHDDVFLLKEAFASAGVRAKIESVSSGDQAIEYFQDTGGRHLPMLTLLDIKMPRVDGFDVLAWVRSRPAPLNGLPIVMLSSSSLAGDIDRAHQLGCNGYVVKPNGLEPLKRLVHAIEAYWLQQHKYPSVCGQKWTFTGR